MKQYVIDELSAAEIASFTKFCNANLRQGLGVWWLEIPAKDNPDAPFYVCVLIEKDKISVELLARSLKSMQTPAFFVNANQLEFIHNFLINSGL